MYDIFSYRRPLTRKIFRISLLIKPFENIFHSRDNNNKIFFARLIFKCIKNIAYPDQKFYFFSREIKLTSTDVNIYLIRRFYAHVGNFFESYYFILFKNKNRSFALFCSLIKL